MKTEAKPDSFVLAGNGPYANRGCEAIVRGTTALLREQAGECRFISNYFAWETCEDAAREIDPAIVHQPFPQLKRYSLSWLTEQVARKVLHRPYNIAGISRTLRRSLQEAKAVLMLGGDTYTLDYGVPHFRFKLNHIALKHGVPVAIWGASVGPFSSNPEFERWAAQELSRVSLICARETETQAYLASIGLEENVTLAADPAFHLIPSTCELPADIERCLSEGCIGLNLSSLQRRYIPRERLNSSGQGTLAAWTEIAADVVRSLLRRFSQPVLLIPHVISPGGDIDRDDHAFLKRVAQLIQEPDGVLVLGPDLNAAQTKWVISRVRVFAGARTHSTLAAISSSVPTVCIGYSMKARGIAKDVYGHLDWLVKGQELMDPAVLCDRLVSLSRQEVEIRSHLERVNPVFRRRAREATRRLLDTVEGYSGSTGDS